MNEEHKQIIIDTLWAIQREGIMLLVEYLEESDYFTAPAAMKNHGCYEGGLAAHHLAVYDKVMSLSSGLNLDMGGASGQLPLAFTQENIAIACLLHDACKINAFSKSKPGSKQAYFSTKGKEPGHALLSIKRIEKFIVLTEIEKLMIKFHMGVYGLYESFGPEGYGAEYHLRGDHIACEGMSKPDSKVFRYGKSMMNAWYHNPICKIVYFADELCTMSEKATVEQSC